MPNNSKRLFLALPLPESIATAVAQWRTQHCGALTGRPVATENLHITLSFLGSVTLPQQQRLCALLEPLAMPSFQLTLDSLAQFPRAAITYLAPSQVAPELIELADCCRQAAIAAGIEQPQPDYRPHLTLFRRSQQENTLHLAPFQFSWSADQFILYQSIDSPQGVSYRPINHWQLTS